MTESELEKVKAEGEALRAERDEVERWLQNARENIEEYRKRAEKAERDRDRWRQAADALGVAPE